MESVERVAAVVKSEEQRFAHTISIAMQEFDKVAKEAAEASKAASITLPGDKLFRLYDTFGMPLDWIMEMAAERGFGVDEPALIREMQSQRERARASWKGGAKEALSPAYRDVLGKGKTVFEGYQQTTSHDCAVTGLIQDGQAVAEVLAGARAELVLDHTPFYAESGGQVGDVGKLLREDSQEEVAVVENTYAPVSGVIAHKIVAKAPIKVGDRLTAVVDADRRSAIRRNHTATHLLHAALRQVLGTHVKQAGSVVDPQRLRFDFAHFTSLDESEISEIETLANTAILDNVEVHTDQMDLDKAVQTGAMAFFGEKYGDRVRVVSVPGFSKELCGGTHVSRTGDIGVLKITSEGGISGRRPAH